ncbi:sensor histidine kinase [Streptococcus massiliensis]|uniref:Sensor histidine kinase n=1 Tax=Streptococcus massiliensis TaxID=313439 RepID=A0A380L245_9STRE|nr:sensor histidine kinase [Streptococcus massiliensis]SUN76640.1 putative histidine kinase [Streptococcus massiliensis]
MKKWYYLSFFLYISLIVGLVIYHLLGLFDISWQNLWSDWVKLEKFLFFVFILSIGFSALLLFLLRMSQELQMRHFQKSIRRLLQGKTLTKTNEKELDQDLVRLSDKLQQLTESVQQSENQAFADRELTVENERRRIARDLHDTVSQELFAASMILSGLSGQVENLDKNQLKTQLTGVGDILETAQKDLRILLLHLRPQELEGRTLVEGMSVILAEVRDKSEVKVFFEHQVGRLPQMIEEHIFRIAQEIISNTLRHAKAHQLSVYLYQNEHELQFKMVDDGIGFERDEADELSYGLKNIQERVQDMAGTMKLLTAPKQGVAIDIRVPILDKSEDDR